MADVRLTRAEEQGKLPAVCMCCGEPATDWVKRSFPLHEPRVQGPSVFLEIYAIQHLFAMANTPTLKLRTSFCPQHRHYWLLRLVLLWGGLAGLLIVLFGGLATVILMITVAKIDSPLVSCCAIGPVLLFLTAWAISTMIVGKRTMRLQLDAGDAVLLRNVDARYVEAVLRQRASSEVAGPSAPEAVTEALPTAIPLGPRPAGSAPEARREDEDDRGVHERPRRTKPDPTIATLATIGGVLIFFRGDGAGRMPIRRRMLRGATASPKLRPRCRCPRNCGSAPVST